MYDTDGNGSIEEEELVEGLCEAGELKRAGLLHAKGKSGSHVLAETTPLGFLTYVA